MLPLFGMGGGLSKINMLLAHFMTALFAVIAFLTTGIHGTTAQIVDAAWTEVLTMRLIDADALMDVIRQHEYRLATKQGSIDYGMFTLGIQQAIDEQPTVDAVEVVRCRDCKYWGDEDGKLQRSDGVLSARCKVHNYLLDGRHTGWCPTENDFCSYGERKDGDGNG